MSHHNDDVENLMMRLPLVPGDCVEPLTTAFRIAALMNELMLISSDSTEPEHTQIGKVHDALFEAFKHAWHRADMAIIAGNWPTDRERSGGSKAEDDER